MATGDLYPTISRLVRFSVPAMLAGMTVPLMGLVDVAVLGRLGDAAVIAAVGVASTIFTTIAWSFSFLRFTTTGLVSQASGRNDEAGIVVEGLRPLLAALVGGVALILLQGPLVTLGLALIAPEPEVAVQVRTYFGIRIIGAPLTLSLYAMQAWLMGTGRPRTLLATQALMTAFNAALSAYLVLIRDLGIGGAAWATVTAEAAAVVVILVLALRHVPAARWRAGLAHVLDGAAWRRLLAANTDLVVRTVLLSLSLALLNERSARLGTEVLAANQLLLQSYLLLATLIDGVSLGVEVYAGRAVGARDAAALKHVVSRGAVMALGWGVVV
ncbi:MAG TPA: MATE family efflux transporter, partial [Trueperaceae bacterium]|nr:MATE family efflux transporter [Trueperaceae bacterium]